MVTNRVPVFLFITLPRLCLVSNFIFFIFAEKTVPTDRFRILYYSIHVLVVQYNPASFCVILVIIVIAIVIIIIVIILVAEEIYISISLCILSLPRRHYEVSVVSE